VAADDRLARIRAITRALDDAVGIPGTRMRFGLDPLIGLVPGLGDLVSAALSGYIVLTGMQLGASRAVVIRMIANVALDTLVGSVPVLGDLFDAGWKSNRRNMTLIEQQLAMPEETRRASRLTIAIGVLVLVAIAAAGITLAILVIRLILGALSS
jgi:hypothetical protein